MEHPTLRIGATGPEVQKLQLALGIQADSAFGKGTDAAVRAFQRKHKLAEDGVVGQQTWQKIDELAQNVAPTTSPAPQVKPVLFTNKPAIIPAPQTQQPAPAQSPPAPTGQWRLAAQQGQIGTSSAGKDMSQGNLLLISPTGEVHSFPFRSGGFGAYTQDTMLPGLNGKVSPGNGNLYAQYGLDYGSMQINSSQLPADMIAENGRGSWLRLSGKYNGRGAELGRDPSGFFGIHTDGSDTPNGHSGDGTKGCLGLEPAVANQFFAMLTAIPANQRPRNLEVVPPATVMTALDALKLSPAIKVAENQEAPPAGTAQRATPPRTSARDHS